tara:strand:- start:7004 stop:7849 length:846 start_codon:yes stop_codon:yes gene_type:complete
MSGYGLDPNLLRRARLLNRVNDRPEPDQARPTRLQAGSSLPPDVDMVARNRRQDTQVVTQRVSRTPFPGGKSVKGKQAWKYPGGNIVRAPSVDINGRYYTDPKEPDAGTPKDQGQPIDNMGDGTPRRKQESNFFITINPNQIYSPEFEGQARKQFEKALMHLQSNAVFARCLKFGPKDEHYVNDLPHDVILPGVDWKANVEVGENMRRMHCHIICYVTHYSQIQINVRMMQYEFRQGFNADLPLGHRLRLTDPPYLQVKMLPQTDWTTIMRQYIKKGMDGA